jgi:D-glycero-alpha-D-manno-heptose-7-phosphate kinase
VLLCRDLETRVLGAPAGTQDYEAARRGGFNVIAYGPGDVTVETSRMDVEAFSKHLVLYDCAEPHSSGLNNWEIFRRRIDGDREVARSLDAVRDASVQMARAAAARDFEGMGLALARDWEARKKLSSRITTPTIAEAEQRAREAGAWGIKACGAGGGGVLVALTPAEKRPAVVAALREMGRGSIFPALPDNEGLKFA